MRRRAGSECCGGGDATCRWAVAASRGAAACAVGCWVAARSLSGAETHTRRWRGGELSLIHISEPTRRS
eukprot:7366355-Prymnesium_polylepis.1